MDDIGDELIRWGDWMAADPQGVDEMPGPKGYEHEWHYVGGPGLPPKSVMQGLPHTKGAVDEARAAHQAPAQDPSARYQTDGKLRSKISGLSPAARVKLAEATPDGSVRDDSALRQAGLVHSPVGQPAKLNADGKRAAQLVREPAAGRAAEQKMQAATGMGAPLPDGYKPGRQIKLDGLPAGVTVHKSGDKAYDGTPIEHVLHGGTLLAKLQPVETRSQLVGRTNISYGTTVRKMYRAEVPDALRRELGLDPQWAKSTATRRQDVVSDIVNMVRAARKRQG